MLPPLSARERGEREVALYIQGVKLYQLEGIRRFLFFDTTLIHTLCKETIKYHAIPPYTGKGHSLFMFILIIWLTTPPVGVSTQCSSASLLPDIFRTRQPNPVIYISLQNLLMKKIILVHGSDIHQLGIVVVANRFGVGPVFFFCQMFVA